MFATNAFPTASPATWNLATMLKTSGITEDVQQHLVRVYATLSACVMAAGLSVAVVLALGPQWLDPQGWLGMLSFLCTTGGSVWLHMEPVRHFQKRFGILMLISAAMGVTMSSLIAIALEVDPSILVSAFLLTTMVFLCFTGSALIATRRSYLYLGGMLSSALSMMFMANLLNVFFRSAMLFNVNLYLGLFLFCGYVVFDTQMIIEKASIGDKDSLKHTLELFMDFVSIFVRILVILLKNAGKEAKPAKNRSGRR